MKYHWGQLCQEFTEIHEQIYGDDSVHSRFPVFISFICLQT